MRHFTVIGLGRFGISTAIELVRLGHHVTGIDADPKMVEKYADLLTITIQCDASDIAALNEIEITASEVVIVAIGSDIQASLMSILALKELDIKNIWVKSNSKAHQKIVSKLGVNKIIHPEEDMGKHVAIALNYPMVEDYISLGNGMYTISLHIPVKFNGLTLKSIFKNHLNDVCPMFIKRNHTLISPVDADFTLAAHDKLLLTAEHHKLKSIETIFQERS